ncbi:hypothetical protein HLA87_00640 [Mycoplasma miroungigenitalium]|uniref:Uncharacterized protein n=1 Tax=Mycoplasma miroungigenitalium TaxID=754515 RepID=A0A6M4JAN6_9MOLU|nr:hypothetical protein [Mycoplasma miroungigenitalium]QJR43318.1 hypothetical protein HLA87_00640 [Mycoplasma miroungigenitalium]
MPGKKIMLPDWATWLLFSSMIIVAIAGVGTWFWSRWKVKKIQAQQSNEEEKQRKLEILQKRGDDLGTLPYDLKDFFGSRVQDWDLESWINTIFLNDYKNVLIVNKNTEYELAVLMLKTKANIFEIQNNININLWNKAVLNFPQYFNRKCKIKTEAELRCISVNLVLANNSLIESFDLFNTYFNMLDKNGMLIIRLDNKKDKSFKSLLKNLKQSLIPFELTTVNSKFIYIVKKNN